MNQKGLSTFKASFNLSVLTFFLLFIRNALSVDPMFEACVPIKCGNQTISYPFWIQGQQESYCGYPGFGLDCKNELPILRIPDNDYVVKEIFYDNQSLRVYNSAVLDSNKVCFPRIRNITLKEDTRFKQYSNLSELILLSNCSNSLRLPEKLLKYRVDCDGDGNDEDWSLLMFSNDTNLGSASDKCKTVVMAPIESLEFFDYLESLRRGFVLNWVANSCSVCGATGGRCGFDPSNHFRCFCPDRPHAAHCVESLCYDKGGQCLNVGDEFKCVNTKQGKRNYILILGTGVPAAAVLLVAVILLYCFGRKCSLVISMIFSKKERENNQKIELFLKNYGSLAPKRYSYSDVKKMTNSFAKKLGQGGYGGVYKGKLQNGHLVAVKVLIDSKGNGEEFTNEVASISRTSHVNVVTLLGFCFEGTKRALIYEFMPNGSLEKFIYDESSSIKRQLGWETLYQIALGIARGLEYLHQGCNTRILHFDIKPHNILLDEDFCPKIADFGLSKLCLKKDSIISMLGARGTFGYIAPEVFSRNFGGVSHKSDVYSYGMMVLEMVGGRRNIDVGVDHSSEIYFPHWIYNRVELDEDLGLHGIMNEEENEKAKKMIIVGLWCIQTNPSNRPSINKVMEMLEGSLESLHIPPKPFLSSPPRPPANSSTIQML